LSFIAYQLLVLTEMQNKVGDKHLFGKYFLRNGYQIRLEVLKANLRSYYDKSICLRIFINDKVQ